MSEAIINLTLDTTGKNTARVWAKQYDSNTRYIKVTVVNGDEVISVPTTATVTINARRDYDDAQNAFVGEVNSDGTLLLPIAYWMVYYEGTVNCDISIYDDGRLSSLSFKLKVQEAATEPTEIIPDEDKDIVTDLIEQVQDAKADLDVAIANAETATEAANTATEAAEGATASANIATENAVNAANNASSAAADAEAATEESEAATSACLTAIQNAVNATESANTAAENAQRVADSVEGRINDIEEQIFLKKRPGFFSSGTTGTWINNTGEGTGYYYYAIPVTEGNAFYLKALNYDTGSGTSLRYGFVAALPEYGTNLSLIENYQIRSLSPNREVLPTAVSSGISYMLAPATAAYFIIMCKFAGDIDLISDLYMYDTIGDYSPSDLGRYKIIVSPKTVLERIEDLEDRESGTEYTFDTTPTSGSNNPVTSDGIRRAINSLNQVTWSDVEGADDGISDDEDYVPSSAAVYKALQDKQAVINSIATETQGDEITAASGAEMSDLFEFAGNGYFSANGVFVSNSGMRGYYYTVTEDADIWVDVSNISTNYVRMKIYEENQTPGTNVGTAKFYSTRDSDSGSVAGAFPDSANAKLHVTAGEIIGISISSTTRYFTLHTGLYEHDIGFTSEAVDNMGTELLESNTFKTGLEEELETDRKVHIMKDSNEQYTITSGKAKYIFKHYTNTSDFVDVWRWTGCYAGGGNIPLWTTGNDSEGPIKARNSSYISGLHGYEQEISHSILADGQAVNINVGDSVECNELSIFVKSEVYYYGDTENIAFQRYVRLDFTYGKIKVTNSWEYIGTRDSTFDIEVWYGGGLFPIHLNYSTFIGFSPNTEPKLFNDTTYSDEDFNEIYFYGEGYTVRMKRLKGYDGFTSGNVKYVEESEQKCYFPAITTTLSNPYTLSQGDKIDASFEVEIF